MARLQKALEAVGDMGALSSHRRPDLQVEEIHRETWSGLEAETVLEKEALSEGGRLARMEEDQRSPPPQTEVPVEQLMQEINQLRQDGEIGGCRVGRTPRQQKSVPPGGFCADVRTQATQEWQHQQTASLPSMVPSPRLFQKGRRIVENDSSSDEEFSLASHRNVGATSENPGLHRRRRRVDSEGSDPGLPAVRGAIHHDLTRFFG